ncbi:hypothetical protein BGZ70_001212 [Mortierella alpina]|uniref:Rho-GAP domain-containing protein n=1 Tax=Mortierella alpina TaxID=64518 RepID=A0A9P6M559_MORAP|nr:hypothetical protein BGZ70_001212 [Mortierella alpina]
MQGDDTSRYLAYFKARLEAEEAYYRSLEKLALSTKGTKTSGLSNNNGNYSNSSGNTGVSGGGAQGQGNPSDPEEIPTTLHMAFDALVETTHQAVLRRRPYLKLLKTLTGALTTLKENHEKQRKAQKEIARPVFQLYAETRLSTVPKLKRAYEQRCRDVEQVLANEDSEHLPVREKLKNLANTSGAAGRLAKSKRDMEDADSEYKTAVQSLETFRIQRERCFDVSFQTMQGMIKERGTTCRQCLEAFVVGERDLLARTKEDMDRFSVVVDCIKPSGDMDQLSLMFTKDIHSHPKPVLYENYYQKVIPETIFGTSLPDYVRKYKHPIPLVIVKCSEAIDRAGLRREGIYRVSGRHAQIMNLKRQFEANEEAVDLTDPSFSEDCASIAAVLKIYLRELPEPLFPFSLNERIAYSSNPDTGARLGELKGRLKRLADCNIDTLQFLIQHLRRIYDHVEYNKMTLENLSMIFTPAIFHDFNSALASGPQPPTHQAVSTDPTANTLSFTSQTSNTGNTGTSPAASPSVNNAPWTGYPPAADQQQARQQQQYYPQNPALGFNHNSMPSSPIMAAEGNTAAITSGPITSSPHLSASATTSSFVPPSNTVSTAASWSNDYVLSDLILNSNTIFNVLPKLPARTNSMMVADDRLLAASMAGVSLHQQPTMGGIVGGVGGNGGGGGGGGYIPISRAYSASRKSSSSSLGTPSSPVDSAANSSGQLRPRTDSLGPNYANRVSPLRDSVDPQQQQQIQQQFLYSDVWQGGRANTPPSPSSSKGPDSLSRPRSNFDMQQQQQQQQYQLPQGQAQQYQQQYQNYPPPPGQAQAQQQQQQQQQQQKQQHFQQQQQ